VIGPGGSLDPQMRNVLLLCWAAMLALLAILLKQRYRLEALRYEMDEIRLDALRRAEPVVAGEKRMNPEAAK
jgi:hypothetical protein